jgi:hypothetical protein
MSSNVVEQPELLERLEPIELLDLLEPVELPEPLEQPQPARRSFLLGAAFLFVGLGLGVGTALAATGAAALLVRDASAATAADVSRNDTPAFPALPPPIADAAGGALHLELVERTPSRAVERAEASAEAQARTRSRNANAPVAVR